MPNGHLVKRYGLISISIIAACILICVSAVDASGTIRYNDLRIQMLETLIKGKFKAVNQSSIDLLISIMTKTLQKGRAFHYIFKLHGAMQRETRRLDNIEDFSSKDWIIQAFRPDVNDENNVTFANCALCDRTQQQTRCHVTHVELLVPVINRDHENETISDLISVVVQGYAVNSSRGTVDISGAVVFDLSTILLKHGNGRGYKGLQITVKRHPCRNVYLNRSMLYEYCNINSTIIERFWSHNRRKGNHKIEVQKNHVENSKFQLNRKNRPSSSIEKEKHKNKELFTMLRQINEEQMDRNSTRFMNESEVMHTSPSIENHNKGQSSRRTTHNRKARSGNNKKPIFSHRLQKEEIIPESEHQQGPWKCARKYNRQKRQFGNRMTNRQDGANSKRFDFMKGECKRHSFFVSLQNDMNRWDIFAPEHEIDIGYCASTCRHANHFINVNSVITAHAVIVNSISGEAPTLSCSPHRMSSISILKMNVRGSFIVENLLNTKVESCWCT